MDKRDNNTRISDDLRALLDVFEQNAILVDFFNFSLDLLVIASLDTGQFKVVNDAWTKELGWSAEELTSKPFFDFVHPDDLEPTQVEYRQQQEAGKEVVDFENRYVTKDGRYVRLCWRSKPLPDKGVIIASARVADEE